MIRLDIGNFNEECVRSRLRDSAYSSFKQVSKISDRARIQRFKEVNQTDYVPGFPLAAAWISRSTSVIICVELSTVIHWLGDDQCKIS